MRRFTEGDVNARADGFYAPDSPSGKRLAAQKAAETRRTNATKRTPRKAAANGRRKATRQTPTRDAVTVEPGPSTPEEAAAAATSPSA